MAEEVRARPDDAAVDQGLSDLCEVFRVEAKAAGEGVVLNA